MIMFMVVIIGLRLLVGSESSFGVRNHPVLNKLRIEMINYDTIKSILFLLIIFIGYYLFKIGQIRHSVLAILYTIVSILDISIVDNEIISPNKKSYRASTLMNKSILNDYLEQDEVINYLKKDSTYYRILPLGILGQENRWSAFHIESIMGYHPAKLNNYNRVKDEIGWSNIGILRMLNVKYLISKEEFNHPAFKKEFSGKLYQNGTYQLASIYKFNYFVPRIFFPKNIEVVEKDDDQIKFLKKVDFDPVNTSIINKKINFIEYDPESKAEILYWSPDKIEIKAEVTKSQLLVLSEIYYPEGWIVTSHPELEIYSINSILRGIIVPKGKQNIIMEFKPYDIKQGSVITLSSIIIILVLIFASYIYKNKNKESYADTI